MNCEYCNREITPDNNFEGLCWDCYNSNIYPDETYEDYETEYLDDEYPY